jgi:hypothetical protein
MHANKSAKLSHCYRMSLWRLTLQFCMRVVVINSLPQSAMQMPVWYRNMGQDCYVLHPARSSVSYNTFQGPSSCPSKKSRRVREVAQSDY